MERLVVGVGRCKGEAGQVFQCAAIEERPLHTGHCTGNDYVVQLDAVAKTLLGQSFYALRQVDCAQRIAVFKSGLADDFLAIQLYVEKVIAAAAKGERHFCH